jgi:flagellar biosynthetic protein FliR
MDHIESLFTIDHRIWPFIAMMFLRIVTIFSFMPILGDKVLPAQVRIGLAIVFTMLLWPQFKIPYQNNAEMLSFSNIFVFSVREMILGAAVGYCGKLLFFAVNFTGQLLGVAMGFQAAQMFSPTTDTEESSFSFFLGITVVTLFMSLNLHHFYFIKIAESMHQFPIGASIHSENLAKLTVIIVENIFFMGLKLAAPVAAIQWLVTIGVGLINRIVPQFNSMYYQMPLCFILGFVVLYLGASGAFQKITMQSASLQSGAINTLLKSRK